MNNEIPRDVLPLILFHRFRLMVVYDPEKEPLRVIINQRIDPYTGKIADLYEPEDEWVARSRYDCNYNQLAMKSISLWKGRTYVFPISCRCEICQELVIKLKS